MPHSRPRYTLSDCVGDPREWSYTWEIRDDVSFSSSCDFCGQGEQRHTYEVMREAARLWVCQRCVGRYEVTGVLEGEALALREARNHLHGLTARLKQRTCQDVIRTVQARSDNPALEEIAVYFDRNLQLSPERAALLFHALGASGLAIDPKIFEVQSRSAAHQDEFGALAQDDRIAVWAALSSQQKRRLDSLGYAPSKSQLAATRMTAVTSPAKSISGRKSEAPSKD